MTRPALYPLRFEPIFKSMLWGGRRLPAMLRREPPTADPVGEAWVLSDVDGNPSTVADGPLAGVTLRELLASDPGRVLGPARAANGRFPLLLKYIDARQEFILDRWCHRQQLIHGPVLDPLQDLADRAPVDVAQHTHDFLDECRRRKGRCIFLTGS